MSYGRGQVKNAARRQAIADAYAAGENTVDVAARFNISRQRVEHVARQYGLPHRRPREVAR